MPKVRPMPTPHAHQSHHDDPFAHLAPLPERVIQRRRERVFLVLAGLFLGTLAMLNILGITRFIAIGSYDPSTGWEWGTFGTYSFAIAVGVLPYPLTFLCTDLISEFYGRQRANFLVWVGLLLNAWVVFILWLGGALPGSESPVYFDMQKLAFGAVTASMLAYLAAQFVDVQLFHFLKWLTNGKHLWLRNNGSTLCSQLVDTTAVILITHYYAKALPINEGQPIAAQLMVFIATGYAVKALAALLDTPIVYAASAFMKPYLRIDPVKEHNAQTEPMMHGHA